MSSRNYSNLTVVPARALHKRCWIAWPDGNAEPEADVEEVRAYVAKVANAIATFEPVTLLANPKQVADASLMSGRSVSTLPMEHSITWLGDLGLRFLRVEDGTQVVCFGGSGPDSEGQQALRDSFLNHLGVAGMASPLPEVDLGALQVDGEGTAIADAAMLGDDQDQKEAHRKALEAALEAHFAIEKVVWLESRRSDGCARLRLASLVRWVRPGVALAPALKESRSPSTAAMLRENLGRLKVAQDARGRDLEVIEIELPGGAAANDKPPRLRSYLDLYIANGGVVMPVFEAAEDQAAYEAVLRAFPDGEVVRVTVPEVVPDAGSLTHMTLAQPQGSQAAGGRLGDDR